MADVRKFEQIDKEELTRFLANCNSDTKVYLGVDSKRVKIRKVWHVDYYGVVVIHVNGNNGCRIFYQIHRDIDYDKRKDKPTLRLMNEVYTVAGLYLNLKDVLENFHPEIHMDINSVQAAGSNHVLNQAIGYIRGTCGVEPKAKPDAFAASFAADRISQLSQIHRALAA